MIDNIFEFHAPDTIAAGIEVYGACINHSHAQINQPTRVGRWFH